LLYGDAKKCTPLAQKSHENRARKTDQNNQLTHRYPIKWSTETKKVSLKKSELQCDQNRLRVPVYSEFTDSTYGSHRA
jgi:hypothetical protein